MYIGRRFSVDNRGQGAPLLADRGRTSRWVLCSYHPSVVVSGLWISGHDIHSRIYPQTKRRSANRAVQALSTDFRKPHDARV